MDHAFQTGQKQTKSQFRISEFVWVPSGFHMYPNAICSKQGLLNTANLMCFVVESSAVKNNKQDCIYFNEAFIDKDLGPDQQLSAIPLNLISPPYGRQPMEKCCSRDTDAPRIKPWRLSHWSSSVNLIWLSSFARNKHSLFGFLHKKMTVFPVPSSTTYLFNH